MVYKNNILYKILKRIYLQFFGGISFRKVDPSICISLTGFSFGRRGWHHLVTLSREMNNDLNLLFENSILYRFHKKYQPEGMYELVKHLDEDIQFKPQLGIFPWGAFQIGRGLSGSLEGVDWNKSRFCGPTSNELIQKEFNEFRRLYRNIQEHGYNPWREGVISGTLLKKHDGESRFIPLQGNHRTAILSYLNYDSILVSSRRDSYDVIYEENVDKWHYVKTGQCSRKDALAYFNAFFELTGFEQAQRFGLIAIE